MTTTSDDPRLIRAAELIATARLARAPLDPLPVDSRPGDVAEGYAVQDILHAKLAAAGQGARVGYKVGCTTAAMQEFLGIPHPCAGGILAGHFHRSGVTLGHGDYVKVGIEVEIAMQLSADLPAHRAPYDADSVALAVGACMASLEIIDDRAADREAHGVAAMIADDFSGAGCVLGPAVVDWQAIDLAAAVGRAEVNGVKAGRSAGREVMGHPLNALVWLANLLAGQGKALRHGEVVLTGSLAYVGDIAPGDTVVAVIDGLGEARASFE
jgi:2-keto-4-pentenoate hydratase